MKRLPAVALLLAFVLAAPAPAGAQAPTTIKLATIGLSDDIGIFVARDRGYFADKGLQVELPPISAAGDVMAMLATNQLQFVSGGFSVPFFNAIIRGLPVRAVAPKALLIPGHDSNVIMIRSDLADVIKRPRDLKGRKFAVNSPVSAVIYWLGKAMESDGLSLKDLDLVSMPFPAMSAAFATKAIDAAIEVEPFVTLLHEKGIAVRWKSSSNFVDDPYMHIAALFTNHEWAERNPQAVQNFVTQYLRGVRVYYETLTTGKHRDEIVGLLTKYTAVKDRALYDRLTWQFVDPNGYIVKRSVADQIAWYARNGMITRTLPVDQVVDMRWVDNALKELGEVSCAKCIR